MLNAETAVIGGILRDPGRLDDLDLSVTDFSDPICRNAWAAIQLLRNDGTPIDVVTVGQAIHDLPAVGQIMHDVPSAANIQAWAAEVKEQSAVRWLYRAGKEIQSIAEGKGTVEDKLSRAHAELEGLGRTQEAGYRSMRETLLETVDYLDKRHQGYQGVRTGFADLDDQITGLEPGDFVLLAARPSMGKTTLAMNIARNVANEGTVAVHSLEMPAEQLQVRLLASEAKVSLSAMRAGRQSEDEWARISPATARLADLPIHIDDTGGLTIGELRARVRKLARQEALSLVIVDYLQLIHGDGENRTQEIRAISQGLKEMAKELRLPVIALSQLNRGLESRANKRPNPSDLRESGSLEQDADHIWFIYREEVYEDTPNAGLAELIVAKQRNGPLGTVYLDFNGALCEFSNTIRRPIITRRKVVRGGFDYTAVEG